MDSKDLKEDINITEDDVIGLLDIFTRVPSLILKGVVAGKSNVVQKFEGQVLEYKAKLSEEEISKILKATEE